jgi:hypothetical protein
MAYTRGRAPRAPTRGTVRYRCYGHADGTAGKDDAARRVAARITSSPSLQVF